RTEALEAGEILVAARLVDRPLAPELGFDRLHRHAIGLLRTVAAALTDHLVDEHALLRIGHEPALAPPPLLRRAGLVVDQHREAGRLAQFPLHGVDLVAMADRHAFGKTGVLRVFARLVGHDHDALCALGRDLSRDLGDAELALDWLAAGHCDRVVVEDLVGDVHARRRGRADRQQGAGRVGRVARTLEGVPLARHAARADP